MEIPEGKSSLIWRVLILLSVMLLCTSAYVFFCMTFVNRNDTTVFNNGRILVVAFVLYICCVIIITCTPLGTYTPCDYILCVIVLVSFSYMAGAFVLRHKTFLVTTAFLITIVLCILLIVMAFFEVNLTGILILLIFCVAALFLVGMAEMIYYFATKKTNPVLHIILCITFVLFWTFCFLMQLRALVFGSRYDLDGDEYVLGATLLYISIVNIFMVLLSMFGIIDEL